MKKERNNYKLNNLKNREEIDFVFKNGKLIFSPYFVIYYISKTDIENVEIIDYLIIASRKVGNAVKRNRAKRLLRALLDATAAYCHERKIEKIIMIARRKIVEKKSTDLAEIFIKKIEKMEKR